MERADLNDARIKYYELALENLRKFQSVFKSMDLIEKIISGVCKQDNRGNYTLEGDKLLQETILNKVDLIGTILYTATTYMNNPEIRQAVLKSKEVWRENTIVLNNMTHAQCIERFMSFIQFILYRLGKWH